MNDKLKKVLAVLVVIAIVGGWLLMIVGIPGKMSPVKDKIQLGLDIKGGVYVVLEAQDTDKLSKEKLKDLMDRTQAVIEKRVDAMGIANPNVSIEGNNRLRIELPGANNSEEAIQQIGKTAQLRFILADQSLVLDGGSVKNASVGRSQDSGQYVVNLEFDRKGAKAFEEGTAKAASGKVNATLIDEKGEKVSKTSIVIMLDSQIISAPNVDETITGGKAEISGNFTEDSAANLAALIKGGSLPVELKEITASEQTAKIGLDAFTMSVYAGFIGLALIYIIMLYGYRIMGLAADIALTLYVVLMLTIMALMGSVLTLPGIAGMILSIGMAVDANVVIFTRIKEEIASGKSIRTSTRIGYKRAMSTVIDSHVTTFIAAVILYQIGTSAVKGFAWTLLLGIVLSIFTAVFVSQLFLVLLADSKTFSKKGLFGIRPDNTLAFGIKKQFNFIKHRKVYYGISIGLISIGIIFALIRGFNFGIDFTGGTMMSIDTGTQASTEKIKEVLKDEGLDTNAVEIVYSGDNKEEVIIKTNESLNVEKRSDVINSLQKALKFKDEDVLSTNHFGPSVGKELKWNAIKAILLAAVGMLIYIRLRFRQWNFGTAAIVGTIHDILIVVGFYAVFHITVNNPFIAAALTVVGYSMNDTIVIFDRIRENLRFMRKGSEAEIIDLSINQTLTRSIMTSFTTVIIMVPLYFLAGSAIREFILPLIVGVITGCLSSIFVCSPLYYSLSKGKDKSKYEKQIEHKKKAQKKNIDEQNNQEQVRIDGDNDSTNEESIYEPTKGQKKQSRKARRKEK